MKNISAGKNTFYICLQTFVYHRSGSHIAQLHACLSGKLILRDQTNRKKKRIAFKKFFGPRNRTSVFIYLCKGDSLHTFFSFYVNHCMTQLQRDPKVIQALHDISLQASGIWHQLCHSLNLCPFQRHTSGHDQSDITGSQDHYFFPRHKSFHVYKALCCSCRINACRTISRNVQRTSRSLSAAHGKDHSLRLDLIHSLLTAHGSDHLILTDIHDHSVQPVLDLLLFYHPDKACCILRSCQLLLKCMKAKSIMDTLIQDPAQFLVTFQDQDALSSLFLCSQGCCQSCRASAYDHDISHHHHFLIHGPRPPLQFSCWFLRSVWKLRLFL